MTGLHLRPLPPRIPIVYNAASVQGGSGATVVSNNEVLKWTVVVSVLLHLVVVLGVSFVLPEPHQPSFSPPLAIALVLPTRDEPPRDAATLAQTDSRGRAEPSELPRGLLMQPNMGGTVRRAPAPQPGTTLTTATAPITTPIAPTPTAPSHHRAALTTHIELAYLGIQARAREQYIRPAARASQYAAYIEQWRLLVERVGNLNYPEAAKQQNLVGSLVLDAAIRADGQVAKVAILQSSGQKILDDAAVRTVHIAAPFAPFPTAMRAEAEIVHIVRTWNFGDATRPGLRVDAIK